MKKLLFLMITLACISGSQAYADYSFNFMSSNGQYGFTGTLYTPFNGSGPLTVTGASLTGDGSSNNGISYALLAAGLTAQNSDGAGANLSGADNLLLPGSNPVLDANGMIFVQNTNYRSNDTLIVNSSTNADPGIGVWGNGSNGYQYFQSWSQYANGTATLTPAANATPIPTTAWLFGAGLLGLVGIRRKLK